MNMGVVNVVSSFHVVVHFSSVLSTRYVRLSMKTKQWKYVIKLQICDVARGRELTLTQNYTTF
jgi:hypothetical protein